MFKVRCATQAGCLLQAILGLRETSTTPATRLCNQVSWQSVCLGTVKDRMASLQFKNYSSFHEENTHTNTHTASRLEESSRSDQISRSVVSYSLRPHESHHARTPCPSPAPPKEIISDQKREGLQMKNIVFQEILKGRQNFNLQSYGMVCVLCRQRGRTRSWKVSGVCR